MPHMSFISNSLGKKHSNGTFHPESAQRLEIIEQWLNQESNANISYELMEEEATEEDIVATHAKNHYELIKRTQGIKHHFHFDADTAANKHTFKASIQAVAVEKGLLPKVRKIILFLHW